MLCKNTVIPRLWFWRVPGRPSLLTAHLSSGQRPVSIARHMSAPSWTGNPVEASSDYSHHQHLTTIS